ncbi:hypothetical protein ABTK71_19465, partial [Acinetobacter baumannii]
KVERTDGWNEDVAVQAAMAAAEKMVEGPGRLNVRASGTQPMLRVMVESESVEARDRAAQLGVDALLQARGGAVYGTVDLTHSLGEYCFGPLM